MSRAAGRILCPGSATLLPHMHENMDSDAPGRWPLATRRAS